MAGCSAPGTGSMPNAQPLATLPGYTHIPATLTPILRILRTPSLGVTAIRSTAARPTPPPLTLDPPNCYETPVGSLWCLGLVRNPLPMILEGIIVRIVLVSSDGTALAERETLIARRIVRSGEVSPYGVLFDSPPIGYAGPVPELVAASPASPANAAAVALTIQNVRGEVRESGFHLSGQLVNTATTTVQVESGVATLFDKRERVIGFRALEHDQPLATGKVLTFDLDVIPQTLAAQDTARYSIDVDGRSTN